MGIDIEMLASLAASVRRVPMALRAAPVRSFRVTQAAWEKLPAQPDVFPAGNLESDETMATGLRREEIEAEVSGLSRFEGEWSGPAGTKADPILVESIADHRIVGIPSRDEHGEEGEIRWFDLKVADGVVEHHGQWFKLKQVEHTIAEGYERAH